MNTPERKHSTKRDINLHQHSMSLTRTISVVLLCLLYKGPVQWNLLMLLSAQSTRKCGVDVLPTKLRPVKIEDENENDFEISEESEGNIIIN